MLMKITFPTLNSSVQKILQAKHLHQITDLITLIICDFRRLESTGRNHHIGSIIFKVKVTSYRRISNLYWNLGASQRDSDLDTFTILLGPNIPLLIIFTDIIGSKSSLQLIYNGLFGLSTLRDRSFLLKFPMKPACGFTLSSTNPQNITSSYASLS